MTNKLLGIYLELTSKCNLRCIHCYNESGEIINEIPILYTVLMFFLSNSKFPFFLISLYMLFNPSTLT